MTHPLTPNLKDLNDNELMKKISELQKRLVQSYQYGQGNISQQIEMLLEDYKEEQRSRDTERMNKHNDQNGKDWDDLIDI